MLVIPGYRDHMIPDHLLIEIANEKGLNFPLSPPIVFEDSNQQWVKAIAMLNQSCLCPKCSKDLTIGELHHALVSRKDIMGGNQQIHNTCNVLVLHPHCHRNITRQESYKHLVDIFGVQTIKKWYCKIKLKSDLRQLSFFEEEVYE